MNAGEFKAAWDRAYTSHANWTPDYVATHLAELEPLRRKAKALDALMPELSAQFTHRDGALRSVESILREAREALAGGREALALDRIVAAADEVSALRKREGEYS